MTMGQEFFLTILGIYEEYRENLTIFRVMA